MIDISEISKAYEPQAVETKWYQFWLDHKCFVADPARVSARRPAYSIVIPPPNVTGVLHMGHVLNNTIQDILARKARMDGKEALWLPGTDHAGISTEGMVAKQIWKQEKKTKRDVGREEFLKRVWAWKEKHGGIIIEQLKKLGCSCDWTRERFTMDEPYVRCVQKVFVDLYRKGRIYRGKRMVNWCPATQTALSDEEVIMKEQKGLLYYFKVEVAELGNAGGATADAGVSTGSSSNTIPTAAGASGATPDAARETRALPAFLTIATTRPETIPGDTAVAVNPKDPRYTQFIGKYVIRPLPPELPREQKLIPIIGDEHVDFEFGTGVLKVTPAHDKADFEIGQRHRLPLRDIMNPDGSMSDLAGADLRGLDRFEARKVAVEKLRALGALAGEKPYQNNVGFSERADVPIEPRLSEQWFLRYPTVDKARACVAQETGSSRVSRADSGVPPESSSPDEADETSAPVGQMHFHPQRWAKVYDHWMGNIQDWCISRQLWWGHRIPVWYNRLGWQALDKTIEVVRLAGDELPGRTARELRQAAWRVAETSGFLRQRFKNRDTGWDIYVHRRSLEHAFANEGMVNIKLVPALPQLLNHAIHITSEPHEPAIPQVVRVHKFLAALQLGAALYRVKFTVKELRDGRKLYDHQAVSVKENETDGKSPGTHPRTGKLVTRPASASRYKLVEITDDVKTDETFTRCQLESPGEGWQQDPDVLDTWFSSWLWPFATMGWTADNEQDSRNPTLQAFYPTADLVTAPEIIFFWVARMIMAGYEFMRDMPFRNVYFTGIIRDKQGRKMSKTLGNSPDPLDLIAKYGADAVRFGTMRSAPLGQDVLFDEKDVELGRNFCNKLWNACRFRQMVGSTDVPVEGEIDPALLTSDDKWILLRLDQAIREIDAAFAGYRFNEVAQTLYRFFWSEYCDWYVEASKAALRPAEPSNHETVKPEAAPTPQRSHAPTSEARRANTLAVIDLVLSHTLRLFHPFLPFITEELWQGMAYHQDLPAGQGGQTIMTARWPKPFDAAFKEHYGLDESDERFVNAKYALVGQGRNLRREASIAAGKKVKFVLKTSRELPAHEVEVLRILLQAEMFELDPNYQPPKGALTVRAELGELYLPLEGLRDVGAERARLTKELEKDNAEIRKVQAKLDNPAFCAKVPPEVLEEHRKRLAEWQAKQQHVHHALEALGEG